MAEDPLGAFLSETKPLLARAIGGRVSALLARAGEGWVVLTGRVTTLNALPKSRRPLRKKAGDLLGVSVYVGKAELQEVIEALNTHQLSIPGLADTRVVPLKKGPLSNHSWMGRTHLGRPEARKELGLDWPAHFAHAFGEMIPLLLHHERIEDASRRCPFGNPPFTNLAHLQRELGLWGSDADISSSASRLSLVVPVWTRLAGVKYHFKSHAVQANLESVGPIDPMVSVSIIPSVGTSGRVVKGTTFKRDPANAGVRSRVFQVPQSEGPISVLLLHNEQHADSARVGLSRPRLDIHSHLDPDFAALRKLLLGPRPEVKQTREDQFERGAAVLFHLLGFSVVSYGASPFEEAVDLVCFDQVGSLVMSIECTTVLPDHAKMKRLRSRVNDIKEVLRRMGRRDCVAAVLMCQARSDELRTADAKASVEDGVILLGRDEIEELLNRLRDGTEHEEVAEYFAKQARLYLHF